MHPRRTLRSPLLLAFTLILGLMGAQAVALAQSSTLTILHTNDLHSHFRPVRMPAFTMGGLGRMKTAIDVARAEATRKNGASILLDGGDWSEGAIYFTADAGQSSLKLLDSMGYDAMVVGNHDWLVGPEIMIDTLKLSKPKLAMIAANFDTSEYKRSADFNSVIAPYTIVTRTVNTGGGATRTLKIAIIGISTYELVYDQFISPIKVLEPFKPVRTAAQALRGQVDLVVGLSHNRIALNEDLLKAIPELDLIVGAHDHVKLMDPVVVTRADQTQAWIVEAGAWGEFLGRLELNLDWSKPGRFKGAPKVTLSRSKLIQIDESIPEDSGMLRLLDEVEKNLTQARGPLFDQKVASSEIDISDRGQESLLGNLIVDAYLTSPEVKAAIRAADPAGANAKPVDIALEHAAFINGILPSGDLTDADLFNAHPSVWNPVQQKSWTVQTFELSGRSLAWLMNLLLAVKPHSSTQTMAMAGAEVLFSPASSTNLLRRMGVGKPLNTSPSPSSLTPETALLMALNDPIGWSAKEIRVGGVPLDPAKMYRVVSSTGILYSLRFVDRYLPGAIVYSNVIDTGFEAWRALKSRVVAVSPVALADIPYGNRFRRYQRADVGMAPSDINVPARSVAVTVTNYGTVAPRAGLHQVGLEVNLNGTDQTIAPKLAPLGKALKIPALKPGESVSLSWSAITLPPISGKWAEVHATLKGDATELNASRMETSRWIPVSRLLEVARPRSTR